MTGKLTFVYIMASQTRTLYVGVTSDLRKRYYQHHHEITEGFTARYQVKKLVYFEVGSSPMGAITREKQLKGWRRDRKVALVESTNPEWNDLGPGL